MNLPPSAQKVQDALAALGLDLPVMELPASTRTSAEAAAAVGCAVGQIAKSILFRARNSGRPVLVITSGSNRVNETRIADLLGEPLDKADAEFVRARTGFAIGGVPPLAHTEALETFVDEDLLQYAEIWAAAGTPHAVFRLTPALLVRIAAGRTVKVGVRYPYLPLNPDPASARLKDQSEERARYVQGMFARIAKRYDLMNRLMTAGQDVGWRKTAIALAQLPSGGRLLDLGSGTGDIALEALRTNGQRLPPVQVVGGDFTLEMMIVGRQRPGGGRVQWAATDALNLPFAAETFDALTSGFLMRNVTDVERALAEQRRVLKTGGRAVCLDTTPPDRRGGHKRSPVQGLIHFHLHTVIPMLGRVISGESDPYSYLPDSTENFLPAETLAEKFAQAGFREVRYKRRMFGTIAIHWGRK